ncbi:hypothetical protein ACJX0J_027437, partial [Zea mays]
VSPLLVWLTCTKIEGLAGHEDIGKLMNMKEDDGISEVRFSLQSAVAKRMTTSKDMSFVLRPNLVHIFDYGSFYPAEVDASHCFIREEANKGGPCWFDWVFITSKFHVV